MKKKAWKISPDQRQGQEEYEGDFNLQEVVLRFGNREETLQINGPAKVNVEIMYDWWHLGRGGWTGRGMPPVELMRKSVTITIKGNYSDSIITALALPPLGLPAPGLPESTTKE